MDRAERARRSRAEDVRLRGFPDRASVEEAVAWIDAKSGSVAWEEVAVPKAAGRVLIDPFAAPFDMPACDCAGIDGYAIRARETVGSGDYNPLSFKLVNDAQALPPFSAALVASGARLPSGADAVLPFEAAQPHEGSIEVFAAVAEGSGVERMGQQVRAGTTILEAGRRLRPQDLGLLAMLGVEHIRVARRPRVRLVIAGPNPGMHLNDANGPMLHALVKRDGGEIESAITGAADRMAMRKALNESHADVIMVAGRTGTGPDDEAAPALAEIGKLCIHGVALRPGGSAGMGTAGEVPVVLLPGDPLACFCSYELFAGRLIRRLGGLSPAFPYAQREFTLGRKIVSSIGTVDLCQVSLDAPTAKPIGMADSGGLAALARSDGFVLVPPPSEGFAAGSRVTVFIYDDRLRPFQS